MKPLIEASEDDPRPKSQVTLENCREIKLKCFSRVDFPAQITQFHQLLRDITRGKFRAVEK